MRRKRKHKFKNYKTFLEATQLDNKIKHLQIHIDNLKANYEEFIKTNKSMIKTQKIFKSEKHNAFTKKFNKIALSSNDDKRMQSIHSIETYVYGTRKELASQKQEIKRKNTIKRYKKCLTFIM